MLYFKPAWRLKVEGRQEVEPPRVLSICTTCNLALGYMFPCVPRKLYHLFQPCHSEGRGPCYIGSINMIWLPKGWLWSGEVGGRRRLMQNQHVSGNYINRFALRRRIIGTSFWRAIWKYIKTNVRFSFIYLRKYMKEKVRARMLSLSRQFTELFS